MARRRRQERHSDASEQREDHLPGGVSATKARPQDLRRARRIRQHGCWDHLVVAPLWVAYRANLGTLVRTCDAAGACLAVPDTAHYHEALAVGETLRGPRRPCIHWVRRGRDRWVVEQQAAGWRIVAVELAEGATPLPRLAPARERTLVLLGHERSGLPAGLVEAADECVEIPMVGRGASLNVAVAGSLVLYRLAGLS
jgi:tRNA G18 (ribose-2'-O)-methylase SpoU